MLHRLTSLATLAFLKKIVDKDFYKVKKRDLKRDLKREYEMLKPVFFFFMHNRNVRLSDRTWSLTLSVF